MAVIIQCHVRIYVVIGALGRIGSVGGEGKSCVANKLLSRSLASGWRGRVDSSSLLGLLNGWESMKTVFVGGEG